MTMLQTLGSGTGFLKAGFLGFPKSGKTYTSALLAIGVRRYFGLEGPIAMFDTEGGSEYVAPLIREATGKDLLGVRSRSLDDLIAVGRECEAGAAPVLIADSMTHVWREICDAYLKQVNAVAQAKGRPQRSRLEFQDWNPIKAKWAVWTDLYLNSRLHVVICGRAGFDYDYEEREDGTGKDLVKTGVKMKTEGEFGFEPSLLIEMERVQVREGGKLGKGFVHRATVIGDRFAKIDGSSADDPDFTFFEPHVSMLKPGAHAGIDTETRSDFGIGDDGTAYAAEKRLRVILCEKVQAELVKRWPGQTKEDKQAKVAALERAFATTSWTEVETRLDSHALQRGLSEIQNMASPGATQETV